MAKAGIGFADLKDVPIATDQGYFGAACMPQDGVLREKPSPRVTNNGKILSRIVKIFE